MAPNSMAAPVTEVMKRFREFKSTIRPVKKIPTARCTSQVMTLIALSIETVVTPKKNKECSGPWALASPLHCVSCAYCLAHCCTMTARRAQTMETMNERNQRELMQTEDADGVNGSELLEVAKSRCWLPLLMSLTSC